MLLVDCVVVCYLVWLERTKHRERHKEGERKGQQKKQMKAKQTEVDIVSHNAMLSLGRAALMDGHLNHLYIQIA